MLGFKRGGVGHVLIRTDSIHETVVNLKGSNGQNLVTDVTYLPQQRTRIYGTVIQLPVSMGNRPIVQINPGSPGYGAIRIQKDEMDSPSPAFYAIGGVLKYKYLSDIEPEVKIDDKIYFKWRAMDSKQNLVAKSTSEPPEYIFKIPYDQIFCIVRDGVIIPVGAHVLIDPEVETFEDVSVPTFYPFIDDKTGKPKIRPKEEWLLKKAFPENMDRHGKVMHIGKPLRGDINVLSVGDRVLYKLKIKNLFTIEDKKYIVLRQDKIIAKLD